MGLHKILKILGLVISLIGVFFLANIIMKGDDAIIDSGIGIDGFLYTAYFIFAIVLIAVIIFGVKGLFSGNIKNTLIIIGAFIVIIAISYAISDNTPMPLKDGKMLSESGSKWVGTGLHMFYILAIIAIGAMIISGFKRAK